MKLTRTSVLATCVALVLLGFAVRRETKEIREEIEHLRLREEAWRKLRQTVDSHLADSEELLRQMSAQH
jgi:hypothetical protein